LPIVETTPSYLHKETYDTANRTLDGLAFNLVRYLNRKGQASFFFTRDGFASLRLLRDRPKAAFGHVMAGKYAGLGTVGLNNCLLTPEFGPRVRLVSVFTEAVLPPDDMIKEDLCILCGACAKCCPVNALAKIPNQVVGSYNVAACLAHHEELNGYKTPPCGICTKVCPVGKDRLLYKQKDIIKKYLNEAEALAADPNDPVYKTWTQVRSYGGWNKDYPRD
jgi:epoxyqueuosine reductase QueG